MDVVEWDTWTAVDLLSQRSCWRDVMVEAAQLSITGLQVSSELGNICFVNHKGCNYVGLLFVENDSCGCKRSELENIVVIERISAVK